MTWPIRAALPQDMAPLRELWQRLWHQVHGPHVPSEVLAFRTPQDFASRLALMGDRLRVAGPPGAPVGFCAIRDDELHQLYVAETEQGSGLAARLIADAEARMAVAGVAEAHLHCLPQNARGRRFYARQGWTDSGDHRVPIDGPDGPFPFVVTVFRKRLA